MGNKNKNIHSKSICIGKIVAIFNAVVSMEFKVLGSIICFQSSELFGNLMFMSNGSYPLYVFCSSLSMFFMNPALNKYC